MALIEDTVIPDEEWSAQVLAAHQLPHAVIGGAVEHAGKGLLNWAVYLMDFGRYTLPLAEGPQQSLTDINVSYKADVLNANGDLWRHRSHEVSCTCGSPETGRGALVAETADGGPPRQGLARIPGGLSERFQWGWVYGTKHRKWLAGSHGLHSLLSVQPSRSSGWPD